MTMSFDPFDPLWVELEELALHDQPWDTGVELRFSKHAVQRFRERVEGVPSQLARHRLEDLAATSEWQLLPRPWMPVLLYDHTQYGFPVPRPDVCLVARDGCVVTVYSQRFVRQSHRSRRRKSRHGRRS